MDRDYAYGILCGELEAIESLGYDSVRAMVGQSYTTQTADPSGQEYIVEVWIAWARAPDGPIHVRARIDRTDWYRLDCLEETLTIEA